MPFSGWVTDSSQVLIIPVSVISTMMDRMIPVASGFKLIFNIIIATLLSFAAGYGLKKIPCLRKVRRILNYWESINIMI